jgi:hypothetical protein
MVKKQRFMTVFRQPNGAARSTREHKAALSLADNACRPDVWSGSGTTKCIKQGLTGVASIRFRRRALKSIATAAPQDETAQPDAAVGLFSTNEFED